MKQKVAVIGGGAAGMMAAISAAKTGAFVEIYEKNDRVGKKLLSTGNGKCNFSNTKMSAKAYYGSAVSLYDKLFSVFGVRETIDFFGQSGMLIKNKNGYLYPLSEQASTVLDILRFSLDKYGVCVRTCSTVEAIKEDGGSGRLRLILKETKDRNGKESDYDAVILACGGRAAPKTGSDGDGFKIAKALGHQVTQVVPALVQLRCREDFFKSVAGVRTEAELILLIGGIEKYRVRGELQLTDYGISGIPVFQFSREAAYALLRGEEVKVTIDFLPDYQQEEYKRFWGERWITQKHQTIEQFLTGIANKKINQLILRLAGCKPSESVETVTQERRRKIEKLYRRLTVSVSETNGFEHAQVCAGGIPAEEITEKLESKLVPHLYFAGEIVDMDGICGGYNLQWAWTSGYIAGCAAASERS